MNIGGIPGTTYPTAPTAQPTTTAPAEGEQTAPTTETAREKPVKGVVRLLQEGHFKGVADVRLRINFSQELADSAAAASGDLAEAQGDFDAGLQDSLAALTEDLAPAEEQAAQLSELGAALTTSVGDLFADFTDAQTDGPEVLGTALQAEADNFAASVSTLLEIEGEAASLQAFQESFTALLSDLANSLTQALQTLPELSEPNGNGAAYAKFLEILEGMQQLDSEPEPILTDIEA